MTNEKELTHIDLFSGIGGFTLAGEWAGFRTIVFCEKEEFCQKVLQKRFGAIITDPKSTRWPTWTSKGQPRRCDSIPLIAEIRDFDGKKYRGATLLTGGFPCQPFSVAGPQRGKKDDRYLWPQMRRVIGEAKPRWILAENVPGIFRMALDTVLTDLESEGYTTGTFIIPACGLNAPHRRNRVWIVANSSGRKIGGQSRGTLVRAKDEEWGNTKNRMSPICSREEIPFSTKPGQADSHKNKGAVEMKTILSYGAGVNSTAIIALALLKKLPMPDYIVFSDTGAEWSHTYKYMDYIESKGIKIIYLTGGNKAMTLIEYCRMKNFIPSRMNRWCTDYWKITPINRFRLSLGEDTKMIIGIDAGEAHRAERKPRRYKHFPLIELGIDRNRCMKIIRKAGLGIPQKSGCFICPYQRKRQWIELKKYHPELWEVAINLEKNSIFKHKNFTYVRGMTIEQFVADQDKQEELDFGFVLDQSCHCYFD